MTSAPMSPSTMVQYGPAMILVRSSTFTPSSGSAMPVFPPRHSGLSYDGIVTITRRGALKSALKLLVRTAALIAALFVPAISFAQAYPAKTVRVVIPWPPGGSNDIVGRMVAQKLSEAMGQQFIVDNRGGASGVLGAEIVAKSPPDGYTIMVHSATHMGNAHLYGSKLGYDTLK